MLTKSEKLSRLTKSETIIISLDEIVDLIESTDDQVGYVLLPVGVDISKKIRKKLKKSGFDITGIVNQDLTSQIKITWNKTWTY